MEKSEDNHEVREIKVDRYRCDLLIVDTDNKKHGHPVLTMLIDSYSRLPIACFISLALPLNETL